MAYIPCAPGTKRLLCDLRDPKEAFRYLPEPWKIIIKCKSNLPDFSISMSKSLLKNVYHKVLRGVAKNLNFLWSPSLSLFRDSV